MRLFTTTLLIFGLCLLAMVTLLAQRRQSSSEQTWLLFSHCPNPQFCDLYRLQPDTKATQFIARKVYGVALNNRREVWLMPRQKWLYFNDQPTGDYELYRVRMDGTRREQLTQLVGSDTILAVSPLGDWLIFQNLTPDFRQISLYAMRPDGTDLTLITTSNQYDALYFRQWLPDAMLISKEGQYYRVSLDDWQLEPILENFGNAQLLAVTADGKHLIIIGRDTTRRGILAVDMDTNSATLLYDLNENQVLMGSFFTNTDGIVVQVISRRNSLQTHLIHIKTDGSGVYSLTPNYANFKAWSPDGEWILYYLYPLAPNSSAVAGLYRVRADGTATQLLTVKTQVPIADVVSKWSPDGQWIFVSHGRSARSRLRIDGSDFKALAESFPPVFFDATAHWSPDGKWVILSGTREGNTDLYRINIATMHADQLTALPNAETFIDWLPISFELPWHPGYLLALGSGLVLIISGWIFHRRKT